MKALIVDRYGKKNGVRIGEMPDPDVRENDVLVQVHAAAVNLLDSKIRNGEFKLILPYRLPLILGNDVAGVVVRVGSRVRRFKPGDQVYARPPQDRIGSFAELISMNEDAVAPGNVCHQVSLHRRGHELNNLYAGLLQLEPQGHPLLKERCGPATRIMGASVS